MVCNMAAKAESMDMDMAAIVQKEIIAMVQEEEELRGKIDKLVGRCNLEGPCSRKADHGHHHC